MKLKEKAKNKLIDKIYTRNESGDIIINMVVNDDNDFLSPYSSECTPIISEGVSNFLESSVQVVPPKETFVLQVQSNCIDDEEKIIYKEGIKQYYSNLLITTKRELRRNFVISLILALMGIATLVLAQIFENFLKTVIWAEVIDIAAWVFLWECVDILTFKVRNLRLNSKRYLAFSTMKIEFLTIDKNK